MFVSCVVVKHGDIDGKLLGRESRKRWPVFDKMYTVETWLSVKSPACSCRAIRAHFNAHIAALFKLRMEEVRFSQIFEYFVVCFK